MAFRTPRLGPGAIYLRSLDGLFRSHPDLIKVAEIEPQALSTKGTEPGSLPRSGPVERQRVAALPQRFLMHGVGYPVGGTICDQERHLGEFQRWAEVLSPPWTSEHLSILHVRGDAGPDRHCGFLMPPLQTDAQVKLAARNIRQRTVVTGLPFAFETGVNYFARRDCEMPDGEFFAAVAEAADCGILLDLTNLWVNDRNGRTKIGDVLARLPLERVWEVHLAGIEFAHGHWLDAHSGAIDPELAGIAAEIIPALPNLGAIIFEAAPDRISRFGPTAFLHEMETLHRLWAAAPAAAEPAPSPEAWEEFIAGRMLAPGDRPGPAVAPLQIRPEDARSFALYATLAASFRSGAIAELFENTTRLLLLALGEHALRDLIERYISVTPPAAFPTDEVLSFRRFMDLNPLPIPGLDEILRFESALIEAGANDAVIQVPVSRNIDAMLADIAAGRLPRPSSERSPVILEIGVDPVPSIRILEEQPAA